MIIRARVPQYGHRARKRSGGTLQQRVSAQIEQSRRDQQAACDHNFVRLTATKDSQRRCTNCGATRSY